MSHLILAKMVQVYHAKKGLAFDCSGRFWGTSLNDKVRQLSCYKGQTWWIDLWVFLAVSLRTSHIRERHWYVLSSPGAWRPCSEISCASCVDLGEILRLAFWYQLYLWSIEKYDFPKLCQDEGLDWLVPKLYLSSCLVFCFFPNLSNFLFFSNSKEQTFLFSPKGGVTASIVEDTDGFLTNLLATMIGQIAGFGRKNHKCLTDS